ncbi:hypothetical protein RJT34_28082 [Clitoria ternatea]|uniref:Uncharacterized protein n=1 Tax=Clitoria ternatea TaxID=43366 RepID=A0AAN9F8H1_CLITE
MFMHCHRLGYYQRVSEWSQQQQRSESWGELRLATQVLNRQQMGRGVSSGGGQSSLGYLFGSGETSSNAPVANNTTSNAPVANNQASNNQRTNNPSTPVNGGRTQNANAPSPPIDKQIPAGIPGSLKNNYHRADGQNCGNFLTDRPSTKVHAAPGGGSSLGYLFGGPGN